MTDAQSQFMGSPRAELALRLERLELPSPGPVVARILELTTDPTASISQYAAVLRSDPALSGRMLRLCNSVIFGQRNPVTNVDRACVLLGIDRIRSLALGFHLARTTTGDGSEEYSRTVWCQSVFRACLGGELARRLEPMVGAEGFVVGLMLDAGLPLMKRLLGPAFDELWQQRWSPPQHYEAELKYLPFTHQQVVAELCRMWQLPRLISDPISHHHYEPSSMRTPEGVLARVAHYVGAMRLDPQGFPKSGEPMTALAMRLFPLSPDDLASVVRQACIEYEAVCSLFEDFADPLEEPVSLSERISCWASKIPTPQPGHAEQIELAGRLIVLRRERDYIKVVAHDEQGDPLTYGNRHADDDPVLLLDELGIELSTIDEVERLRGAFARLRAG